MRWLITHRRSECLAQRIRIPPSLYVLHLLSSLEQYVETFLQGELEHRTSKGRFIRTNRKAFVPQLVSIERRQARIRCIRVRRDALNLTDPVPNEPDEHHLIGRSQNFPEDLTRFVQANIGDPATTVSFQ